MRKADTVIYLDAGVGFCHGNYFLGIKNVRTCKFHTYSYNKDNPMRGIVMRKGDLNMEFDQLMSDRYSVRKFLDKKVEPAIIEKLKEAILLAPSAINCQPIRAWVIESKEKLEQIKAITKYHFQAPLTIAIGYVPGEAWVRQSDGRNHGVVDASIAAMQVWLAAENIGLGAAWVSDFDTEEQKKLFPEMKDAEIVAFMQIGYPAPEAKPAAWHFQSKNEEDLISHL